MKTASGISDSGERAIAQEMALLIANDAFNHPIPGSKIQGSSRPVEIFDDDILAKARLEIAMEMQTDERGKEQEGFESAWAELHDLSSALPGLSSYGEDEVDERQLMTEAFDVSTRG